MVNRVDDADLIFVGPNFQAKLERMPTGSTKGTAQAYYLNNYDYVDPSMIDAASVRQITKEGGVW